MSIAAAQGEAFTIDDLDRFPDDGLRYELVDGTLIVTAAPSRLHQLMAVRILRLLDDACPPDLQPLPGPVEVARPPDTLFQPDVAVFLAGDIRAARFEASPPLLVVEVLSPSTRHLDRGLKRLAYREAGVGAFWIADPLEPSVTVLRWQGDAEHEQVVTGSDHLEVDFPARIDLCPEALISSR
jgi:Uma2 family endonuclease